MKQDAKVFFVRFNASKMTRLQHFCGVLKALARNIKMNVQLVMQFSARETYPRESTSRNQNNKK